MRCVSTENKLSHLPKRCDRRTAYHVNATVIPSYFRNEAGLGLQLLYENAIAFVREAWPRVKKNRMWSTLLQIGEQRIDVSKNA